MVDFNEVQIGDMIRYEDDDYRILYYGIVVNKTASDDKIHVCWMNHNYSPFNIIQPYNNLNREGWSLVK